MAHRLLFINSPARSHNRPQWQKGPYAQHYADHQGAYGALADSDLGAYFTYRGQEFVLLGAQPHAQKDKLVGQNLLDGTESTFTVECVERALGEEMKARVKRKYEQNKDRYAKFAVSDVGLRRMEGVDPHAIYPHECFYRAYRYATDSIRLLEEGIWLVHGECILARNAHAWVTARKESKSKFLGDISGATPHPPHHRPARNPPETDPAIWPW